MFLHPRITTPPLGRRGLRARLLPIVPWIFILGVAVGTVAANQGWRGVWPDRWSSARTHSRDGGHDNANDAQILWQRAGNPQTRHAATVLRTIDGDTFEARVALWPNLTTTARVRLRGIDAPELKAMCADELRRAEAAADALDALLREGNVVIYNIGPDKYAGRVVADAATRHTPNVSAALLNGGFVRAYDGGHRSGWCGEGR